MEGRSVSDTVYQIVMITLGGGVLVTSLRVAFAFGQDRAKVNARLIAIEDELGEHGKVGLLWKFFEDGTLHRMRERGNIRENSPMSFTAALERTRAYGGISRSIFDRFMDMVPRAPKDDADLLAFVIAELGWETTIKQNAARLNWPRMDYAYQWKIAIEEAQRDGLDVVAAKLRPYIVDESD